MSLSKSYAHVLSRAVIIDQDHILLCKTLDLPTNFYFLPGGHIEQGESAHDALLRELMEETGSTGSIKRFLGCLEHGFEPGQNSICHTHEYNFIFEVTSDTLTLNQPIPRLEKHIDLNWVLVSQIPTLDFRPQPFKKILSEWLESCLNNAFKTTM